MESAQQQLVSSADKLSGELQLQHSCTLLPPMQGHMTNTEQLEEFVQIAWNKHVAVHQSWYACLTSTCNIKL